MSFDHIQLPSSVLSDLYKQVVVTEDFASMPGYPARKREEVSTVMSPGSGQEKEMMFAGDTGQTFREEAPPAIPQSSQQPQSTAQPAASFNQADTQFSVSQPSAAATIKPNPAGGPVSDAPYRMLGKNARHVAIVVNCPTEPFLPEDQLQLLAKMLEACKLNLGDVAIVNHATQAVRFEQLNAQLQPRQVILFGVLPEHTGMPLSFPPFKEQEYAGCTYLLASSLQAMNQPNEEGKSLKGKLWGCLKKMFNI